MDEAERLLASLESEEPYERYSAAGKLGEWYAKERTTPVPLTDVAEKVADVNHRYGNVARPFISWFTWREETLEAWRRQTDVPLGDWLCDILCRQPDVGFVFGPMGIGELAKRFFREEATKVARKMMAAGAPSMWVWRMAVAAEKPTIEGKELLEQLVVVDDLETAASASGQLAARYRIVHPRAAERGWVVEDRVGEFVLFWIRLQEEIPDRVWGWREDFGSFTRQDALLRIEETVRPAKLGEPLQILFESNLRFEDFYVELSDPNFPLYERSVFANDWVTVFYRFLLSPWNHEVWANLPRVKRIASEMPFHPKQTATDGDPPQADDAPRT